MPSWTSPARRSWPSTSSADRLTSAARGHRCAPQGRVLIASANLRYGSLWAASKKWHDEAQASCCRVPTAFRLPVLAQVRVQPRRRLAPCQRRALRRVGRRRRLFRSPQGLALCMPRTVLVTETTGYLQLACPTRFGYPDEMELLLSPAERVVREHAASRLAPFWDFGVNRRCVERLRQQLESVPKM